MRYLVMLITMFWLQNAVAFNFQNHRVICQMAYEQLTPKAQAGVEQVIGKARFKSFAEACPWPDQIRQQPSYKHTKYWHYINVPRSANKVSKSHCPAQGCLFTGIEQAQQRLQKNSNDWQALLFLGHFIGDLHQPMHVSYADDRGGNQVRLQQRKKATNLHALWDGGLLKRKQWQKHSDELLLRINSKEAKQWRQGSVESWATESLLITQDIYRLHPPSNKINDSYVNLFAPKLELQIQKASVRLAAILQTIYG